MKYLEYFDDFVLDIVSSLVIGLVSIAIYLLYSLGPEHALMLIEQSSHAALNVVIFIVVWTTLGQLLGALIQALKKLKAAHTRNEVPQ